MRAGGTFLAGLVAGLLVSMAAAASAQGRPIAETSDFWREVRQPGVSRAEVLIRHARILAGRAQRALREQPNNPPRHVAAAWYEGAIQRCRRALELTPNDPEALFLLAVLYSVYEEPRPGRAPRRMVEEAIAAFEALRRDHADFRPAEVASELAILHSRNHDDVRAVEEYERALRFPGNLSPEAASTISSNLAESYMMLQRLPEAVRMYRRAIELVGQDTADLRPLVLARFGLAVALDRHGEHAEALREAERARTAGHGMDALTSQGVFFQPDSEVHFYLALGHMAAAAAAPETERASALWLARAQWADYLALSPDGDPWRALAERHAAEVEAQLQALPEEAR